MVSSRYGSCLVSTGNQRLAFAFPKNWIEEFLVSEKFKICQFSSISWCSESVYCKILTPAMYPGHNIDQSQALMQNIELCLRRRLPAGKLKQIASLTSSTEIPMLTRKRAKSSENKYIDLLCKSRLSSFIRMYLKECTFKIWVLSLYPDFSSKEFTCILLLYC